MALNLSLSEILVNLERQIESLREQIGLHARQEEHHREQRTLREAELEHATTHLESFRSVAAVAADLTDVACGLASPTAPAPPPRPPQRRSNRCAPRRCADRSPSEIPQSQPVVAPGRQRLALVHGYDREDPAGVRLDGAQAGTRGQVREA